MGGEDSLEKGEEAIGFWPLPVEPGGVEPPSKQLTDVLSTCLSGGWLSGMLRTSAPKASLSLLKLHRRVEVSHRLSRLSLHLLVSSRRSGRLGDVPFPRLAGELSRTYCSSVRQRERSCFRQLLFCVCFQGLWRVGLHAYKPMIPAVKTKQPQCNG